MKLNDVDIFINDIKYVDTINDIPDTTEYRIIYFNSGTGRLFFDKKLYKFSKGDIFIWRTNLKLELELSASMYLVEFNFIPKSGKTDKKMFEDFDDLNSCVLFNQFDILSTEFLEMYNEFLWKKRFYRERCSVILQKAMYLMCRSLGTKDDSVTNKIDLVVEYIHKHYAEKITNDDIGRNVNYHPHYLNKLMLEYKGVTLHRYLTEFRINSAKIFIKTTDRDIGAIATDCGFVNLSHFTKAFKQCVGISPTEFRKKSRESK